MELVAVNLQSMYRGAAGRVVYERVKVEDYKRRSWESVVRMQKVARRMVVHLYTSRREKEVAVIRTNAASILQVSATAPGSERQAGSGRPATG